MTHTGTRWQTLPALLLLPIAAVTGASEYSLEYSVEARYEYDDNVRLRADNEIDVSAGRLILPATLTRRTERLDASLMGELSFSEFNEQGYNSDDQNLQGVATYQLERGLVEGNAGYKRTSTLDSEFTDTGRIGLFATRKEIASAGASGHHMITERNGFSAGFDYSQVDYDSPEYQNYDYVSGYAGWLHQWSERTQLLVQGYGYRYQNDVREKVESDGLGGQLGFKSDFSEQLSASLLAGWVATDTTYSSRLPATPDDDSDGNLLVDGSLTYKQERYRIKATLRSGSTPSGNGFVRITDQLDLSYRYQWSDRTRLSLVLIAGQSSALDNDIDNDRDYARLRTRVDYQFSRQWYIAGTYTYSYQKRERESGTAVYLSLIFQPEKSVWSR